CICPQHVCPSGKSTSQPSRSSRRTTSLAVSGYSVSVRQVANSATRGPLMTGPRECGPGRVTLIVKASPGCPDPTCSVPFRSGTHPRMILLNVPPDRQPSHPERRMRCSPVPVSGTVTGSRVLSTWLCRELGKLTAALLPFFPAPRGRHGGQRICCRAPRGRHAVIRACGCASGDLPVVGGVQHEGSLAGKERRRVPVAGLGHLPRKPIIQLLSSPELAGGLGPVPAARQYVGALIGQVRAQCRVGARVASSGLVQRISRTHVVTAQASVRRERQRGHQAM